MPSNENNIDVLMLATSPPSLSLVSRQSRSGRDLLCRGGGPDTSNQALREHARRTAAWGGDASAASYRPFAHPRRIDAYGPYYIYGALALATLVFFGAGSAVDYALDPRLYDADDYRASNAERDLVLECSLVVLQLVVNVALIVAAFYAIKHWNLQHSVYHNVSMGALWVLSIHAQRGLSVRVRTVVEKVFIGLEADKSTPDAREVAAVAAAAAAAATAAPSRARPRPPPSLLSPAAARDPRSHEGVPSPPPPPPPPPLIRSTPINDLPILPN